MSLDIKSREYVGESESDQMLFTEMFFAVFYKKVRKYCEMRNGRNLQVLVVIWDSERLVSPHFSPWAQPTRNPKSQLQFNPENPIQADILKLQKRLLTQDHSYQRRTAHFAPNNISYFSDSVFCISKCLWTIFLSLYFLVLLAGPSAELPTPSPTMALSCWMAPTPCHRGQKEIRRWKKR